MRTTITLDDALLSDAKRIAAETNRTLSAVIEEALRERVARRRQQDATAHVDLPTDGSGGLRPGVDLDDSAALLDLMEEDDRPL